MSSLDQVSEAMKRDHGSENTKGTPGATFAGAKVGSLIRPGRGGEGDRIPNAPGVSASESGIGTSCSGWQNLLSC